MNFLNGQGFTIYPQTYSNGRGSLYSMSQMLNMTSVKDIGQTRQVIYGDHGPYLLGDCTTMANYSASDISRSHLQDRYGEFIAVRWPDILESSTYDIKTIQDVFPAIFSALFDDEEVWKHKPSNVTGVFKDSYIDNGIIQGRIDDGEPLYRH